MAGAPPARADQLPVRHSGEYWLPDDYILLLTAIEAGALTGYLLQLRETLASNFLINKRGPHGEKIPMLVIDRLLEKIQEEVDRHR